MDLILKLLVFAHLFAIINGYLMKTPNCQNCKQAVTTVSGPLAPKGKIEPGQLIFEDNFNKFNLKAWEHSLTLSGKGTFEFQWYTSNRSNSFTENGKLHIRPTLVADIFGEDFLTQGTLNLHGASPKSQCTAPFFYGCERTGSPSNYLNPAISVRIATTSSFYFKYGRVEVRAKMPTGDWLTPNVWLLPDLLQYGPFPVSGVIALVESRGNENYVENGTNIGTEQVTHSLEYTPFPGFLQQKTKRKIENSKLNKKPGWNKEFHRYQLLWTPDNITFSVDDVVSTTINPGDGFWERAEYGKKFPGMENPWRTGTKMAPFDEEFFLLIQLGVGGIIDFPDDAENLGGKPWKNDKPNAAAGDFWKGRDQWMPTWNFKDLENAFQIDYVRVWAI